MYRPYILCVGFNTQIRICVQIDDSRPQWSGYGAILWGNVLLTGLTSSDSLVGANPDEVEQWVVRNASAPAGTLSFNVNSTCGAFEMVPMYTM